MRSLPVRLLSAAAVTLGIGALVALTPVHHASALTLPVPVLPDLRMSRLANFQIGTDPTQPGRTLLRFDATVVNTGAAGGTFEVLGSRPDTATPTMSVSQVIHNADGSTVTVPTAASMIFEDGDGHHHWHTVGFERYQLTSSSGKVITSPKIGFCFYDNGAYDLSLPGAPQAPVFTGCGDETSLSVDTGLSVGWGDTYPADRYAQWVDITGLRDGVYRLTATADPNHYFAETNPANNTVWADLSISNGQVTPLRYGDVVGLTATYRVTRQTHNRFNATVTVTNRDIIPVHSWQVIWQWAGNQAIGDSWNTQLTQTGTTVTANNARHNGTINPGRSVTFGFSARYSGTNTAPVLSVSGS